MMIDTASTIPAETQKKTVSAFHGWMFRNHRWFGVVSCFAVILWGASGVMHPIMSRINPTPINMQPPVSPLQLESALVPSEVLAQARIIEVENLRVIAWSNATYYQVTLPKQATRRYFEVNSGHELVDGDLRYAEYLARHFIGDTSSPLRGVSLVTQFDDDYLDINRLLPVYRVDLERKDGLHAYIDTRSACISALVDDRKALLGSLFRWLHNWDFLRDANSLRIGLISFFLGLTLLSATSGIWMYGFMWKRGTLQSAHIPLRRWHRTVGILVSVSALLFVISAEWHLLGSKPRQVSQTLESPISAVQISLPEAVRQGSWSYISLNQWMGVPLYEVKAIDSKVVNTMPIAEHNHSNKPEDVAQTKAKPQVIYMKTNGTVVQDTARIQAIWLASQFSHISNEKVMKVGLISKFEGEYGFLNKRLPVWRVDYDTQDHVSYYVETTTGALATVVRDANRAEGWSFSYLHKFHWLDFTGKDFRDFVMGVFGLGNLLVAVFGLWMFTRRYQRSKKSASV